MVSTLLCKPPSIAGLSTTITKGSTQWYFWQFVMHTIGISVVVFFYQYLCINGHCLYQYRFTLIDLGDVGRHIDGGVLAHSNFGQALEDNSLSFPAHCPLPGTTQLAPYVIVGDEAFPLHTNMLWPYPGRNLTGVCGFQFR